MVRRMVILLLILMLSGLVWTSPTPAITYDSTDYTYNVLARNQDESDSRGLPHDSYPPVVYASVDGANAYISGYPSTRLYAQADAVGNDASSQAYLKFTGTFTASPPAVKLSFDYDYEISPDSSGDITCKVKVSTYLLDPSIGNVWEAYYEFNWGDPTTVFTGSFEQDIPLTTGGGMLVLLLDVRTSVGSSGSVSAFAEISNLSMEPVPLPSTLLLVGTGLLSLGAIGWRRKGN